MKSLWITALGLAVGVVPAMAGGWKVSLGPSYRTFGDVSFEPLTLSAAPGGRFVNGDWVSEEEYQVLSEDQLPQAGFADWVIGPLPDVGETQEWTLEGFTFDQTVFAGSDDEEMDDAPGAVLSFFKVLYANDNGWWIAGKIGLGWFSSDMNASASEGNGLTTTTWEALLKVADPNPGGPSWYPTDPFGGAGTDATMVSPTVSPTAPATTSSRLAMDADLDLYVLSFGAQACRTLGPVSLSIEAGPSLNLADFSTSVSQSISWTGGGVSRSESDDSLDVFLGVYAAGGVTWQFHEQLDVSIEARWDEVFGDAETDQAEIDLSGASLSLTLGYHF